MHRQSIIVRRFTTPPPQLIAKMRPLLRVIQFPRGGSAFVDVRLRMPPMFQRTPLCKAPEATAKIAQPLILPSPWLTFCRFSVKSRPLLSFD